MRKAKMVSEKHISEQGWKKLEERQYKGQKRNGRKFNRKQHEINTKLNKPLGGGIQLIIFSGLAVKQKDKSAEYLGVAVFKL